MWRRLGGRDGTHAPHAGSGGALPQGRRAENTRRPWAGGRSGHCRVRMAGTSPWRQQQICAPLPLRREPRYALVRNAAHAQ